jgi:hypothetical protein
MSAVSNASTAFPPSMKVRDFTLLTEVADETVFGRHPPTILNVTTNASGIEERRIVHPWKIGQPLKLIRYDDPENDEIVIRPPPSMNNNDTVIFKPRESLAWFDESGDGHRINPTDGTNDHLELDPGHIEATADDPNNKGKFIVESIAVHPNETVSCTPTLSVMRKSFYEYEMPRTIVDEPLLLETGSECKFQKGSYTPSGDVADSQIGDLRPRRTFMQLPSHG